MLIYKVSIVIKILIIFIIIITLDKTQYMKKEKRKNIIKYEFYFP